MQDRPFRASIMFLEEISKIPGDLELPGPPTVLQHADKNVTRVVGSYNLASHDGKFGNRPGRKLRHVRAWKKLNIRLRMFQRDHSVRHPYLLEMLCVFVWPCKVPAGTFEVGLYHTP